MKKGITKKLTSAALAASLLFSSYGVASAATYKVKAGDTLSKIAREYGTTYTAIMKENNLSTTTIRVGQTLHINEKKTISSAVASIAKQASVVDVAKKYIGTPYVYGGTTAKGFDCSGLVYHVLNQSGKSINRLTAAGFYSKSTKTTAPKAGDLVFFKATPKSGITHVGIYIGDGKMISSTNSGVKIDNVKTGYWGQRFTAYGRI